MKRGQKVKIYHDPITMKNLEGVGTLRTFLGTEVFIPNVVKQEWRVRIGQDEVSRVILVWADRTPVSSEEIQLYHEGEHRKFYKLAQGRKSQKTASKEGSTSKKANIYLEKSERTSKASKRLRGRPKKSSAPKSWQAISLYIAVPGHLVEQLQAETDPAKRYEILTGKRADKNNFRILEPEIKSIFAKPDPETLELRNKMIGRVWGQVDE